MTPDTMTRPTYCPEWCVVSREQHESEREQWDGSCIHWSESFGTVDGESLVIGMSTDVDGGVDSGPTVHVGPIEYSLSEAQTVATAFSAAFTTARATAPTTRRSTE